MHTGVYVAFGAAHERTWRACETASAATATRRQRPPLRNVGPALAILVRETATATARRAAARAIAADSGIRCPADQARAVVFLAHGAPS